MKLLCSLCRLTTGIGIAALSFHAYAEDLVPLANIPLPPPANRYPVKNDQKSIKEAYAKSEQWDGRAVSVDGVIKSIETDVRGRPSVELAVGADTTVWATWPQPQGMDKFLSIGERLRVLGWLRDSAAWATVTKLDLPRQNPMTLLPICLVKVRNSNAAFDRKYAEYCEAWERGYMPPNMAIR
jgi:hypothetical protein